VAASGFASAALSADAAFVSDIVITSVTSPQRASPCVLTAFRRGFSSLMAPQMRLPTVIALQMLPVIASLRAASGLSRYFWHVLTSFSMSPMTFARPSSAEATAVSASLSSCMTALAMPAISSLPKSITIGHAPFMNETFAVKAPTISARGLDIPDSAKLDTAALTYARRALSTA